MSEYILGVNETELARLRFQQEVWGPVTDAFLDRAGVPRGARVLDAGCGPGMVTGSLRERAGEEGSVTALDESPVWQACLADAVAARGWTNVVPLLGKLEEVELGERAFDVVFCRWVLSFLPDPAAAVAKLARALAPGGLLLVQDYNHEGLSLFPRSAGFDAMVRAVRAFYSRAGGDVWIAGRLPRLLFDAGFEVFDVRSTVLSGGPDSPAFRWADAFFPYFCRVFEEGGLIGPEERELFLREWEERKGDPGAVFFSPIVVDVGGKRGAG